jgi:hypothetical protein
LAARYTIVMYTPSDLVNMFVVSIGWFVMTCGVLFLAVYAVRYAWCRVFGITTSIAAEDLARQLMGLLDEVDGAPEEFLLKLGGEPEGHKFSVRPGAFKRCAVATALKVRSVMDCNNATEANRLCVHSLAGKFLRELNVRDSDVARLLPVICVAAFLPSEEDILMAELSQTSWVVRAIRKKESYYTTRDRQVWLERRWGDRAGGLRFTG